MALNTPEFELPVWFAARMLLEEALREARLDYYGLAGDPQRMLESHMECATLYCHGRLTTGTPHAPCRMLYFTERVVELLGNRFEYLDPAYPDNVIAQLEKM